MKKTLISFSLFIGCFCPVLAYGQVQTFPYQNPNVQFFDNLGVVCSGCTLSTFAAGTVTPLATYSDAAGTVLNSNPITLDSAGRATIYITSASYKFVLKSALGVTLVTQDNITAANLASTLTSLTVNGTVQVIPSTAATSGANQSGPLSEFCGNIWNGSASVADCWKLQPVEGTGSNPTSTLTLTHSGSTGTASVNFGSFPLSAGAGTLASLNVTGNSTLSEVVDPFTDIRAFGAKCDWNGTSGTDDSTALQTAINTAISTGSWLVIPKGKKCSHASTLDMTNGGSTSVRMRGTGYSSGLVYTGTGSGWKWKDGTGTTSIFDAVVRDVFFVCSNAAGCSKGIEAWDLQNGYFDRILINAGVGFASTDFFCDGCAILDINGLVMEGQTAAASPAIGFDCLGCASIWLHNGNYGFFPTATMRFAGATTGIVIESNWFESQDIGVLIDDSVAQTTIDGGFYITHNRFLENGAFSVVAPGGTFTNQVALKLNNTGTNSLIVRGMEFTENNYFCATSGSLCAAAYPILINYSATTGGSTLVNMGIQQSHFLGQSTGLVNVTNGPSAAQTQLTFKDNDERVTTTLASGTTYVIVPVESNQSVSTQVHLAANTDTAEHVMLNGGLTTDQDSCLDFGDHNQALKAELCWGHAGNAMSMSDNSITGWQVLNDGSLKTNVGLRESNILIFPGAPTVSSGFGTSPTIPSNNGPASFTVNIGTGGTATTGVIGLPTAATAWNCTCQDTTTFSTTVFLCRQTASSTTTATIGNFNSSAVAAAWAASDVLNVSCLAR